MKDALRPYPSRRRSVQVSQYRTGNIYDVVNLKDSFEEAVRSSYKDDVNGHNKALADQVAAAKSLKLDALSSKFESRE